MQSQDIAALIVDPLRKDIQEWWYIRQCVPLRVTVVQLKPRNFHENGCPEIPEIPEISILGSVFRESDCYDKYRKYRNCSAIPKFPELLELPEITRKLRKELEIPEISFKITVKTCKICP